MIILLTLICNKQKTPDEKAEEISGIKKTNSDVTEHGASLKMLS